MQRTAQLLKSGSVAKVPEGARNNNKKRRECSVQRLLVATVAMAAKQWQL